MQHSAAPCSVRHPEHSAAPCSTLQHPLNRNATPRPGLPRRHTDSVPSEGEDGREEGPLTQALFASTLHYIGLLIPLQPTDAGCGRTDIQFGSHLTHGAPSLAPPTCQISMVGDAAARLTRV